MFKYDVKDKDEVGRKIKKWIENQKYKAKHVSIEISDCPAGIEEATE
jgi:septum formation inhibitor-activating ATPase MinD